MKIVYFFLKAIGIILIVFNSYGLFKTLLTERSNTGYMIGLLIGQGVFLFIGIALVITANDIKRKAKKKKDANSLINSLPGE